MKYQHLQDRLTNLEADIFSALEDVIDTSKTYSKHIQGCKAIKVNVFDYTELVEYNDHLTFLDKNGHHYSIDCDVLLEDLIDILNKIN